MPSHNKLQRWTDLLAALLRYHFPVPFETLRREVPAYARTRASTASLMRKFERDKDELRAFGVPIETLVDADGNLSQYRLASKAFYLPYLHLVNERPPRRPKGVGYAGLKCLAFEPDELAMVVAAARRVQSLGDPALAREAASALRKIAHDLPVASVPSPRELIVQDDALDGALFDELADAVRRRKTVTFIYFSMHRDDTSTRHVDPYGLAYISGHWYLIGHDHDAGALRQYRVRRMSGLEVNAKKAQSADFDVPASFKLWEHTRSRQAWELGDAESRTVVVRFTEPRGYVVPAMRLGAAVAGDPMARAFHVRRVDSFLRWILGFAGAARPVEPADVVAEYDALLRATLAVYDDVKPAGQAKAQ